MPGERRPPEPWRSFLRELDRQLGEVTNLHCMGGFAVSQAYGRARSTVDIDVLGIVPHANLS